MSLPRLPTDAEIAALIREIDGFHGNELKERSKDSVAQEVATIKRFLKGLR